MIKRNPNKYWKLCTTSVNKTVKTNPIRNDGVFCYLKFTFYILVINYIIEYLYNKKIWPKDLLT